MLDQGMLPIAAGDLLSGRHQMGWSLGFHIISPASASACRC
jgi:hypothetical protein